MRRFIFRGCAFILIGFLMGEVIVRYFNLTVDIPKMYVDKFGRIRTYPNQTGNFFGATHNWIVNKYGFYGYEPPSLDSLVIVVGDSFISNQLNPPSCHQCNYLSQFDSTFNFFTVSRDGGSFLDFMEISKDLDSLNYVCQLIYVHDDDFIKSIAELGREKTMTQIQLKNRHFFPGELSFSKLKGFLYHFKFPYYLFRKAKGSKKPLVEDEILTDSPTDKKMIEQFLSYVRGSYRIEDKVLIFRPGSGETMISLAKQAGFRVFVLNWSNDKPWTLKNDHHWSCYGQQQAARQVSSFLKTLKKSKQNSR